MKNPQTSRKPSNSSLPSMERVSLPLQTRLAQLDEAQAGAEDRTFNMIFTTGAIVRKYDFMTGEMYDEELVVSPETVRLGRLNSGAAPVLDTHSDYALENIKGVVLAGTARIEGGLGYASFKVDGGAENESVIRKIQNGIIRNVSVGYRVHKREVIRNEGAVPLYRAIDWEPYEVSLVPIGADAGAGIRSNPHIFPCEDVTISTPTKETRTMKNNATNPQEPQTAPATNPAENPPADNPATPPVEPPANPAPEPEGEPDPAHPEHQRAEGMRLERGRITEIQKITRAAMLPDTFAQKLVTDGVTIPNARKAVLDEMARRSGEGGEIRTHVSITRDELDSARAMVENALLHRHNPKAYQLDNGAREFRGMSLMEIGRDLLERRGVRTRGMSKSEMAGIMLGLDTRGGLHSTSDFPFILANVANKTLRSAYEAAPQTFKPFSRQTTNPDFKNIARTQLGDAPSLDKVNESGEFKRGTVGEAREQYALATYGKVVAITRQTIINDDLAAFTRLPEMFGRAAADLESDTVWGILTANAAMGDGTALFHATHGNLAGAGAAIAVAPLGDGRAGMRKQKGLNGRFINVMAKYLLVPAAIETVAEQFVTQTNIIYTKSSDYNPFANKLQVIAEPRLDAASLISWYLAADPAQIDTIEYAYLEGQEGV
ncbi:MAG: peptidase U37, partial [Alphaproteobacteria bacterium]|nr:peptidase U37 [Alphaproteobacteria bacterium]